MDSTWINNSKIMYYVAKMFGFLPFASGHRIMPLLYPLFLWLFLGLSGVYMCVYHYEKTQNVTSKYSLLVKVIFIETLLKFFVAVLSTAISTQKTKGVIGLLNEFYKFDIFTLRVQCPPDVRAQTLYLLYALLIGVYNFVCGLSYTDVVFYILFMWNMLCALTMLIVVQYITYVRMLRVRYTMANTVFANSVMKNISPGIQYMYPKEINSMFIELRGLTEEVKTAYAYHAMLFIVETVLILISCATTLTVNYLNELDTTFINNGYFIGHCSLRLLFLYFVVRETHKATLEANNTVLIVHEALHIISDIATANHLEVIILNCWNHPTTFDVHDYFDLDYKLLQSIIASVVTYVVVLVQIQLAITMDV